MSDRFAEKLRQKRRRTWWRIAAVALVAVLLAAAGWAVWFSSLFDIRDVKVQGIEHVQLQRVLSTAAVPTDKPLLRLDTEAVVERVAALKPVESVRVERDLPHTVRIVVTERSAVAWIDQSGTPWAVDASGIIYRPLNAEPSHLPQLDVDDEDRRIIGATAQVAADIADGDPELLGDVEAIRAETRDSIELDLTKDRTVVWGSAEEATAKLAVLEPLLRIEARSYDVSAPERPTTLQ